MAQQTAVEWLVEKLNSKYGNDDFIITHINEIEQAKQMEKDQSQPKISDEDIYNKAKFHDGSDYSIGQHHGFIEGAKWAINKLKNK